VVTPLTIDTVPLLLSLAFGKSDVPVFVSGTRNLYKSTLRMIYREDIHPFDLIQNRTGSANGEKFLFEGCKIYDFEIRIEREQWIKLRFDVESEIRPKKIISDDKKYNEYVDCFSSDHVIYSIDRQECNNIYGVTIHCIKQEGFLTEIWIKEVLEQGSDVRIEIEELLITARLLRDKYEANQFGSFNIIMRNLVLTRDETNVESSGAVMGVRHYFVMGSVTAEVFQLGDEPL
jgi:hypothetical protein